MKNISFARLSTEFHLKSISLTGADF